MALFGGSKLKDVVTLAVESTEVRYLSTKAGSIDRWGSVPLAENLVADGLVTNAVEMGQILDQIMQAWDLDRKRVIVAVSGLRSIPRTLTLPKMQSSLLGSAVSREARKEMPIALDELYLSWQVIEDMGDQQKVYLLGVPRDLIDGHVRSLQAAGIKPYVMDLKPLALIRAVRRREAIIVNLEKDMLDVMLVVNHLPAIMRSFSLEKEELDEQGRLDRLLNELTQTVRFYNDSHRSEPLDPSTSVLVSGRLLGTQAAVDYLKNVVERPVERPQPTLDCPDDLPTAEYLTNLGLATKKVP